MTLLVLTSAHLLDKVYPFLPSSLIDSAGFDRIRRVGERLPASSTMGFESRLDQAHPGADFLVAFDPSEESKVLAGVHPSVRLSDDLLSHPSWRHVRECGVALNQLTASEENQFDNLWLEFDVAERLEEPPVPGIFLGIEPTADTHERSIDAAMLLTGQKVKPSIYRVLETCLQLLPSESRAFQVGVMHGRKDHRIRLYVRLPSSPSIARFLQDIGWVGPVSSVIDLLSKLEPFVHHFTLGIDVGEEVGPTVGLECYPTVSVLPEAGPVWERFLDQLVTLGLCLPAKRDGLLAWPGYRTETVWWPRVFSRRLHHVKLVLDGDQPARAKAYFGFVQAWIRREAQR